VVQLAATLRWAGLALVAAAVMLVVAWRPRLATGAAVVAIAITGADLVTLDRGYLPAIPLAEADPPLPAAILHAQEWDGHQRVTGGEGLQPNLASRFGLRGTRIHALPALKRRNMLWFGLGGSGLLQRLESTPRRLGSLYGAKYVFVNEDQTLSDPKTKRLGPGLFENRAALPRAWIAYDWTPASTPERALSALKGQRPQDDMRRPVIEGASPPASGGEPTPDPAPAQFTEDSDERVALRVDARRAGYLVLSDTYYPGWQATLDGRRADVRPADVAFRAVAIPAGRHTVAFEYHPWSVKLGGALSLAALAAIALGLLLTRRGQLDRAPIIVLVDDHRSECHDADDLRVGRRPARVRAMAECLLRPRRG
jgi:hypothetical protein